MFARAMWACIGIVIIILTTAQRLGAACRYADADECWSAAQMNFQLSKCSFIVVISVLIRRFSHISHMIRWLPTVELSLRQMIDACEILIKFKFCHASIQSASYHSVRLGRSKSIVFSFILRFEHTHTHSYGDDLCEPTEAPITQPSMVCHRRVRVWMEMPSKLLC